MRSRIRELLPTSESQRFEKTGRRQINDPLAGQKINEAEGFRWPRGDAIAFFCVLRQSLHENRVISWPLRCFCPPSALPPLALLTQQTQIILVSPESLLMKIIQMTAGRKL